VLIEQMDRENDEAVVVDMEGDGSEWSQTRFGEYSVPDAEGRE
jgi:hypothetical protein